MYPLWYKVIAPILEASGARRVVEIGALAGETTVKLLDLLGPEGEVHVIDPAPQFDPSEHEQRFSGRYHFHRATSHEVLPTLPPADAALIDGDHNWYTVYNELGMLARTAREAEAPLPVLFLHDVGWPYGRRDLYYAPERIPEEHRQPWAQKGLRLRRGKAGKTDLLERGGFNMKMNNAVREGGPRNGVMTALEDFISEYDRELRLRVVPIYFSLAIVAEEDLIEGRPQLADAFDRLESAELQRELLELSERLRVKEMHWGQVVFYRWQDRLELIAERYLELLRTRIDASPEELDRLSSCLQGIQAEKVEGDLVQCGLDGAEAAILMRGFAEAHETGAASVWLDPNGSARAGGSSTPSFDRLRERLGELGLLGEEVRLLSGEISGLADDAIEKAALLRVGADVPVEHALEGLYEKVTLGGYVVVDGCEEPDRRDAVDRFLAARGVDGQAERSGSTVAWRRLG